MMLTAIAVIAGAHIVGAGVVWFFATFTEL